MLNEFELSIKDEVGSVFVVCAVTVTSVRLLKVVGLKIPSTVVSSLDALLTTSAADPVKYGLRVGDDGVDAFSKAAGEPVSFKAE